MTTFHGLIQKNIVNANLQFEKLGYITNNISNQNTTAYKSVSFEQVLSEDGYLSGVLRKDYRPAVLMITDNKFDMGINGQGFFPVTSPEGDVKYTRDGAMMQNKDGYLVTRDGYLVGDGIKLPINYDDWWIKSNGDVVVSMKYGDKPQKIGTIPIVQFDCPEALEQGHNNKMVYNDESGAPKIIKGSDNIRQYATEVSNTNIYDEINDLMRLNTSMIASMNLMKVADDMYNKAINIRE